MMGRKQVLGVVVSVLLGLTSVAQAQNWTGDGGKGMSITILTPKPTGLAENQNHLPALVQGEFVRSFSDYSAISVLDWERLDEIYLNLMSDMYDDKAREGLDLGNLAQTTHILGGSITKTPEGYSLQMHITQNSDKTTIASFIGNFTYWDISNLTGIRRVALELLQKVGVTLSAKAQQELTGAVTENQILGRAAQARGITAQRQGTEIAALSYYFQAATFDSTLTLAGKRSSVLNANIISGNIGANVSNDIQWRKEWVTRLKETEVFFDNFNRIESMPYTLFYVPDVKQGAINYENETVTMSIETYLYNSSVWTISIERALQAVWDGLNATKRKDTWQLGNWPQQGVTELKAFERRSQEFAVVFELLNNQNNVIGAQTLQAGGFWELNWSGRPVVNISAPDRKTLNFQSVSVNDISDNMTIRVVSVNEEDAEIAAISGVLQIRAISKSYVIENDRFKFAKGEIQGFTDRPNTKGSKFDRGERMIALVIPSTVWGDPVVSIGDGAFKDIHIVSIILPNNCTYIGSEAFRSRAYSDASTINITMGANVKMARDAFSIQYVDCGATQQTDNNLPYFYHKNGMNAGTYHFPVVNCTALGWRYGTHEEEAVKMKSNKKGNLMFQIIGWTVLIGGLILLKSGK
ncbi:MAG: leucine-rich repeat domain-containing protein [Chitinispirillia bacterium]|nr:leucine-rich repeat domain-containing protein [Chitinispirillia bacterium]